MPPPQEIIPLVAIVFTMMIPISIVLTRHQQKMTMLMRQDHAPQQNSHDLQAVQYEVQQLKTMVASIAMSVDDLRNEVKSQSQSQLQERVRIEE